MGRLLVVDSRNVRGFQSTTKTTEGTVQLVAAIVCTLVVVLFILVYIGFDEYINRIDRWDSHED